MGSKLETVIGFLVIVVAIGFAMFTYKFSEIKKYSGDSYVLTAKFDQIEGVNVGTSVKISGIDIGSVTGIKLDSESYQAVVSLAIKSQVRLPDDSSAQVTSEGLLKNKYIGILAGANSEMLKPNSEIQYTQSSISLESLIGKLVYNFSQK